MDASTSPLEAVARHNGLMLANNSLVVAHSIDNYQVFLASVQRYLPSAQTDVVYEYVNNEDEKLKKINSLTRKRLKDVVSSRSLFLLPDPIETKCFITKKNQSIFKIKKKQPTTPVQPSKSSKIESIMSNPTKPGTSRAKSKLKDGISSLARGSTPSRSFKIKRRNGSLSAEVSLLEEIPQNHVLNPEKIKAKNIRFSITSPTCITRENSKSMPSKTTLIELAEIQSKLQETEKKVKIVRLNKSCQKLTSPRQAYHDKPIQPFKSEECIFEFNKLTLKPDSQDDNCQGNDKIKLLFASFQLTTSEASNRSVASVSSQETSHLRKSNQNPSIILDLEEERSVQQEVLRKSHQPVIRQTDRSNAVYRSLASSSKFQVVHPSPKAMSRSGEKKEEEDHECSDQEELEIDSQLMSRYSELRSATKKKTTGSLRRILIDPIRKNSVVEHLSRELMSALTYDSPKRHKKSDVSSASQKL